MRLTVSAEQILQLQNKLHSNSSFRVFWQCWSNYSGMFYIAGVLWLWYSLRTTEIPWQLALQMIIGIIIARFIVTPIISAFHKKQRPYQQLQFEPITSIWLSWKTTAKNSFPSRHLMVLSVISVITLSYNYYLGLVFMGMTMLTGVGRVILGYHWVVDIVGGMILGAMIGLLVSFSL